MSAPEECGRCEGQGVLPCDTQDDDTCSCGVCPRCGGTGWVRSGFEYVLATLLAEAEADDTDTLLHPDRAAAVVGALEEIRSLRFDLDRALANTRAAADWEAIRQTVNCTTCKNKDCPECDGSGLVGEDHGQGNIEYLGCQYCMSEHCPACEDGKIPMARLLAVGAAVFAVESIGDGWIVKLPGHLATNTAELLLTQLRSVQP